MSDRIDKPVFIIGAGRSGSSVFYSVFSRHPQIVWMSRLLNKYRFGDDLTFYRRMMKAADNAWIGEKFREKLPARECYPYWHSVFSGYGAPFRDLTENDVTNRVRKRMIQAMEQIAFGGKNRHVIKQTGWSRIRFLKEIFPEARFIHIVRDGRAVSNSLLNVAFWKGYQGQHQWRWGPLDENNTELLNRYQGSFVALAGIQWNIILQSVREAGEQLDEGDFMEIRYEDFCENPLQIMEEVMRFSGLEWSESIRRKLGQVNVRSNNYKWKQDLTSAQIHCLNDIMAENLAKFTYSTEY